MTGFLPKDVTKSFTQVAEGPSVGVIVDLRSICNFWSPG